MRKSLLWIPIAVGVWLLICRKGHAPSPPLGPAGGSATAAASSAASSRGMGPQRTRVEVGPRAAELATGSTEVEVEVQFLAFPSREPMSEIGVRCMEAGGFDATRVSREDGLIRLPLGVWRFDLGTSLSASPKPIALVPFARAIVWVFRRSDVRIRVAEGDGKPLVGASIRWRNRHASAVVPENWSATIATGADGSALLRSVPPAALRVRVTAPGFKGRNVDKLREDGDLEVVLAASAAFVELQVVDEATNRPVDAALALPYSVWVLPAETTGVGRFRICRDDLAYDHEPIRLASPNHAAVTVTLPKDAVDLLVPLRRSVPIRISLSRPGLSARLLGELTEVPETPNGVTFENRWQGDLLPNGSWLLDPPLDATVKVRAFASDGSWGEVTFVAGPQSSEIEVPVHVAPTLRITGVGGQSVLGETYHAEIAMPVGNSTVSSRADGTLVVPFADQVRKIILRAPGFETVKLYSTGEPAGGDLTVRFVASTLVQIGVVDDLGARVAGAQIHLAYRDSSAFTRYPELHGRLPTTHSGWNRKPAPNYWGRTDGNGYLAVSLSAGRWDVMARCGGTVPDHADVHHERRTTFLVGRTAQELELDLARAELAQVQAYDAWTGEPVDRLSVLAAGLVGSGEVISGRRLTISIPLTLDQFEVAAKGYHRQEVRVVRGQDFYRVVLRPTSIPGQIEFVGEGVGALPGLGIRLYATRDRHPGGKVVWSDSLTITSFESTELYLSLAEQQVVFVSDIPGWRFVPEQQIWTDGGTLVYRAVRR